MRWLVVLLVGCNSSPANIPRPAYGLQMRVTLAPNLPNVTDISVASLRLHLGNLTAVSDRSSNDPRARKDFAEVMFGESAEIALDSAPPGLYSAVSWGLGDADTDGIDLIGAIGGQNLHVELIGGPFDVRCQDPRSLAPNQRVRLTLTVDATHWFDGVDLSGVKNDEDDRGIIINMEDNAPLAFEMLGNVINSFQLECDPW
jgi:hypothetical protein